MELQLLALQVELRLYHPQGICGKLLSLELVLVRVFDRARVEQ